MFLPADIYVCELKSAVTVSVSTDTIGERTAPGSSPVNRKCVNV